MKPSVCIYRKVHNYTSTNVTTAAYVQLDAALGATVPFIEIFDSSGRIVEFAYGAVGSEVANFYIFPGGQSGLVTVSLSQGMRLALKAVDGTASTGYLVINGYR